MNLLIVFQVIILIIVLIIGLEIILRIKGFRPEKLKLEKSNISPEGKFYKADPVLGFTHQEGEYQLEIKERFNFTSHHDDQGRRITNNQTKETDANDNKPEIWIFGCSYSYGWLLENHEAYPWILQEKLNNYRIVNYSVNGFGSLQSYFRFKEALKTNQLPELVVLGYCSFHDTRDTFERSWKKQLANAERVSPFIVPCARLGENGELVFKKDKVAYRKIPFASYSSLLSYIGFRYDRYHDKKLNSTKVGRKILLEFNQLCKKNNIEFVIAGLDTIKNTKINLDYFKEQGIRVADVQVDKGSKNPEHNFFPYDFHPNALAHKKYAERLITYLSDENLTNFPTSKKNM